MTSAHRPTFDHAKGKTSSVSSTITHKRALTSHSKLKFRNKKIKKSDEFEEDSKDHDNSDTLEGRRIGGLDKKDVLKLKNELEDTNDDKVTENENNNQVSSQGGNEPDDKLENESEAESSDEGEEEESDDEEALLREMALIKKEREEAKKKAEEEEIEKRALISNPLIKVDDGNDAKDVKTKKKSWRSNKTISKKSTLSEKDKFTNDTLKSEFHKDFLDKYIK